MKRFTIYDLRLTRPVAAVCVAAVCVAAVCDRRRRSQSAATAALLCVLCALGAGRSDAATIKYFDLPATNKAAGSNIVAVAVGSGTNDLKGLRVDDFFSSYAGSGIAARTVWVATNGNDSTGLRERIDRPFATTPAAKNAALAGDTIVAFPGTYYNCTNLLKPGVNWSGWPGATLTHTNTTNNGPGWGIFDDRFTGATTSIISGDFNYIWSRGQPGTNAGGEACCYPTNVMGGVVTTNHKTSLTFNFNQFQYATLGNPFPAAIFIKNCRRAIIQGNSIDDIFYYTNFFVGLDEFAGPVYERSGGIGLYWESGETVFKVPLVSAGYYSVYPLGDSQTHSNLSVTGDHYLGKIYIQGDAAVPADWRTWFDVKQVEVTTNNTAGSLRTAITILGGGRHYFECLKILGLDTGLNMSAGEVWLNVQKLSAGGRYLQVNGGTLHATVDDWEDLGLTEGILVNGTGNLQLKYGGRMVVTNGVGLNFDIGATGRVANMVIDTSQTSSTNNPPVFLRTNGLILANCTLVAPATANSIMATNARSVRLHGHIMANKNTNALVSILSGTFEVDTDVD
jgi:hypothetical protein